MTLRDVPRAWRRRWPLILGSVVVAVAVAAAVTFNRTPLYAATTGVFVSTTPYDSSEAYQGSAVAARRMASYADLATGEELARRVAVRLGLDTAPRALAEQVEASVVPDTVNLDVTVTDPIPRNARVLSQVFAEELVVLVHELERAPGRDNAPLRVSIVDLAPRPVGPVSPQPVRDLGLAALLGLLLGLALAVARDRRDDAMGSAGDTGDAVDVPVLAELGHDEVDGRRPLVATRDAQDPRSEAFHALASQLQYVGVDRDGLALVVTSTGRGEGRTTVVGNLAVALAERGDRVLLVDGDLRHPGVAGLFGLEPSVGLTTVLVGATGVDRALQPTAVPNLTVLTSGATPPNPAELLGSRALQELLDRARKSYDVVLVDAPPLLDAPETATLASHADGALIVVRHDRTTRKQLRRSVDRLLEADARAVGLVLTMVPPRGGGGRRGKGAAGRSARKRHR